jgi:hypothetical protein
MDLFGCVSLSNWTGENVQSDKPENALVQFTVFRMNTPFMKPMSA